MDVPRAFVIKRSLYIKNCRRFFHRKDEDDETGMERSKKSPMKECKPS